MATQFHVSGPGTAFGNPPGNDNSFATSVNASGEIVGQAFNSAGSCGNSNGGQNVARFDGTPKVLIGGLTPYVAGSGTVAYASYFSGTSSCTTGILSAALFPSGTVNLPSNAACSDAAYSQPSDVDEAGDVVGNYAVGQSGNCRYQAFDAGFLSTSTGSSEVLGPGGIPDIVTGVNANLWVVGFTANGAFVWSNGSAEYLQPTLPASCDNWFLLQATDVNNSGEIVGIGQVNGVYHGFLLKPE